MEIIKKERWSLQLLGRKENGKCLGKNIISFPLIKILKIFDCVLVAQMKTPENTMVFILSFILFVLNHTQWGIGSKTEGHTIFKWILDRTHVK
jgi:hypothetical protein